MRATLELVASQLEETGWAAELCDADWTVVWLSTQLKVIVGEDDDEALGVGEHVLGARRHAVWRRVIVPETRRRWLADNVPQMLEDTPGGREGLIALADLELHDVIRAAEPPRFPAWTSLIDLRSARGPLRVRYFGVRVRDPDGRGVATLYLYGSNLPAGLLALVAQGSRSMFERMARLIAPGRREAAILFADLQASGRLSRRLPSAAYFELIRALITAIDAVVVDHDGIVGKHAGDGVSAFFLVDDLGSASAAARAAVGAARGISAAARRVAAENDLEDDDVRLNVGAHWGGTLYMGQVTTGGRLEVTALGDEVNECARIQQAAREGMVLASKALVERLAPSDAGAVGLDPDLATYRALAELPGADEKVVRDAGVLPVTLVEAPV